jgi:hypothetical protein
MPFAVHALGVRLIVALLRPVPRRIRRTDTDQGPGASADARTHSRTVPTARGAADQRADRGAGERARHARLDLRL